jgi:2-dehydro-3-deoxyphosphogluconate aldolase/(4S)-4-hydroxy-2-oxoglutarate aldolase
MNDVLKKLSAIGIVPVVVINDADKAVPLAKALVEGGIPCAEVTFRTAAAEEAIKRMAEEVPELIVGAGTVLTKEQADKAVAAGSKFLVSPGLDPELIVRKRTTHHLLLVQLTLLTLTMLLSLVLK